jgi:tropomyosin 1
MIKQNNKHKFNFNLKRVRKIMETRLNHDSDRVETLERQLREARELAAESDRKFEEVSRKLVVLESDVERSEDRAGHSQNKIAKLEEELRLVNNALKTLELNEEKVILFS